MKSKKMTLHEKAKRFDDIQKYLFDVWCARKTETIDAIHNEKIMMQFTKYETFDIDIMKLFKFVEGNIEINTIK